MFLHLQKLRCVSRTHMWDDQTWQSPNTMQRQQTGGGRRHLDGSQTKLQEPEHGPAQVGGGATTPKEGPRDAALEQQAEAQGVSPPRTHTPREHKHLWHLNTSPCYP